MRILLAIDGSSYSDIATRMLEALHLPSETKVTVITVVPEHAFLGGITLDMLRGTAPAKKKVQREKAVKLLSGPVQLLSASGLNVESLVRWGNPAEVILDVTEEYESSLVVMGSKGLTNSPVFHLGSVAQTVIKHARTSVLLAKKRSARANRGLQPGETAVNIDRVLLATDGSKYSDRVNQFLLDLPLPKQSQVIVVTALHSQIATLVKIPTLDLRTNRQVLADLQSAEEKEARKITSRSRQQFQKKGYSATSLLLPGEAGESILQAAREADANIIALGSSGMTGVESFLMGSVAERVAEYAPCSVLIVRPPKA